MSTKVQRLILLGSLGVGYYIYRNTLREVIYENQNTFLNSALLSQLQSQNFTIVGQNRVLIGNPINKSYDSNRERIVILGGGIVGLTTAYYLSKLKKYDVILIEQNDSFIQGPDGSSKGIIYPSQCFPQTDISFLANALKSVYSQDTPVKFSWRGIIERNITIWLTNYFLNITGSSQVQGTRKLAHLANLSMDEINLLTTEMELKELCEMTAKGTIHLYSSQSAMEAHRNRLEVLRNTPISIKELDQDQLLQLEPGLELGAKKFERGYLGAMDTNINMSKLNMKLAQLAEINGVTLLPGTEFHRFLFQQETRKMVGVITGQGIILCDKVVIAGGIKSKEIAHKLGVRVPILGSQEYTITARMPENRKLSHNISDDKTRSFLSSLNRKYFINGCSDFGYDVFPIRDERVQYLLKGAKEKVGDFDSDTIDIWASIKSLSADDVPIIGAIPKYENIYLNTGHGNKGLTLAFGSGKVLSEIIDTRAKKNIEADYSLDRFYLV